MNRSSEIVQAFLMLLQNNNVKHYCYDGLEEQAVILLFVDGRPITKAKDEVRFYSSFVRFRTGSVSGCGRKEQHIVVDYSDPILIHCFEQCKTAYSYNLLFK